MDKEKYLCEKCGFSFEISPAQRLTTFVLHKPHEWQCPTCGRTCYELKSNKNAVQEKE